ncbi:unnamed protein product [Linum tenue]|uniref:Integrator complex subunit 3 N-terminal domain-containing protein n=1 Tax=Linum tenue TaxID=586396 RepID=A0AAV0KV93_9ROSI|nr:unnamed protein product [Linum tenue]
MELEPRLRPPFSIAIPTPQEYSQLNHALLYGVLTEPQFAKIHVKHLHGLVSDGYALFVSLTLRVVLELYNKLVDSVKQQLIWAVNEIVGVFGVGFDGLLMHSYTVANGVSLAFNSLVTKGVINNVDTLTSCDALSPFLKERLKKLLSSTNETLPHQLCPSRLPHCSADASHLETPASHPKHEPAGA